MKEGEKSAATHNCIKTWESSKTLKYCLKTFLLLSALPMMIQLSGKISHLAQKN